MPLHLDLRDRCRDVAQPLRDTEGGGIHELDGGESESGEVGKCRHRGGQRLEHEQPCRDRRAHLDRAEAGLGNEGECALGADDEVLQDAHGVIEVEERVQPVTHGVLHGELLAQEGDALGGCEQTCPQIEQALGDRGFRGVQQLIRIRTAGVEDRSAREHDRHRLDRPVRVLGDAAGHSAGVVRDDSADRAGDLAGGVGAELAAIARESGVDLAHGGAGADAHGRAVVFHADLAEAAAGVDEDVPAHALPGEAGAPGAERHRAAGGANGSEGACHPFGIRGGEHRIRDQQVVGGVVGAGEAVDGARMDLSRGAQQVGVQRFGEGGRHGAPLLRRKVINEIVRQVYRACGSSIG